MSSAPKIALDGRAQAMVHRVITRYLLGQAGLKADEADSGAVMLMQRFGSAANLNVHLHCLVLDDVYRRGTDGAPEFIDAPVPTGEALQTVLRKIITRTMKLLTRRGCWSKRRVRPTWPSTTVIRTGPAWSGRCRPQRELTASPSVRVLARRC